MFIPAQAIGHEPMQMSNDRWVNKEIILYKHNRILYNENDKMLICCHFSGTGGCCIN